MSTNIIIIIASFIAGYIIISTLLNYSNKVYNKSGDQGFDKQDVDSIRDEELPK